MIDNTKIQKYGRNDNYDNSIMVSQKTSMIGLSLIYFTYSIREDTTMQQMVDVAITLYTTFLAIFEIISVCNNRTLTK